MSATEKTVQEIDATFTAALMTGEGKGAWTFVIMPGSGDYFGTRRPVKVAGTMDGHPFRATFLPWGDGTHMLPVKAALRTLISAGQPGDEVTVHLTQRFS